MNFEDGVKRAIRSYYRGEIPEATFEQFPDMKYTPQYFAEFEEELMKKYQKQDYLELLEVLVI